jgi:hypothetical protein
VLRFEPNTELLAVRESPRANQDRTPLAARDGSQIDP